MREAENTDANYVHKLTFSVSDTLLAARLGLNARNIWVFWKGVMLAWALLLFFTYAGFFAAGFSVPDKFSSAGFFPLPGALFMQNVPSVVLLVVGVLFALSVLMESVFKVSRLVFEQLRGDQFYSEADAARCYSANWKAVFAAPTAVAVGVLLGMLLLLIIGFSARIPFAGPVLFGILSVPAVALGFFLVLAVFVFFLSVVFAPVVTAATKGDTFECLFELFSTVTFRPMWLFRGFVAGTFMRVIAIVVLSVFAWGSVALASKAFSAAGTDGFSETVESGLSAAAPEAVPLYSSIFSPFSSGTHFDMRMRGVSGVFASFTGVALFVLLLAYWLSSGTALWTVMYLGARYNRDGEDLLLRAEQEEYREFNRRYGTAADREGGNS